MRVITPVYEVKNLLFASQELAVHSLRLTYHKIAKVVPNATLTQCTIVYDDKRPNEVVEILRLPLYHAPEHL